jgi:ribonuclease P/MRP protein subunit RPP1
MAIAETISGKVLRKSPIERLSTLRNISISGSAPFQKRSRLTVILDDLQQIHSLSANNASIQSYDLIAIRPCSEKLFHQSCQSIECDIISLNFSDRFPFQLKFPAVNSAILRGVFFEICYAPIVADSTSRHHFLSNCINLIRVTKGKNIIMSSCTAEALSIRNPYDVMNFCALIGLSRLQAKAAISANSQAALLHGEIRRSAQVSCTFL